MKLKSVNHIAIICSNYEKSLKFYTEILGFEMIEEEYRAERQSYRTALSLNGEYLIELFTFPNCPPRPSYPEALGLRHIAFTVDNLDAVIAELESKGVAHEPIRYDERHGEKIIFFMDPDQLPIEITEIIN